jgi:hypothetical protein
LISYLNFLLARFRHPSRALPSSFFLFQLTRVPAFASLANPPLGFPHLPCFSAVDSTHIRAVVNRRPLQKKVHPLFSEPPPLPSTSLAIDERRRFWQRGRRMHARTRGPAASQSDRPIRRNSTFVIASTADQGFGACDFLPANNPSNPKGGVRFAHTKPAATASVLGPFPIGRRLPHSSRPFDGSGSLAANQGGRERCSPYFRSFSTPTTVVQTRPFLSGHPATVDWLLRALRGFRPCRGALVPRVPGTCTYPASLGRLTPPPPPLPLSPGSNALRHPSIYYLALNSSHAVTWGSPCAGSHTSRARYRRRMIHP